MPGSPRGTMNSVLGRAIVQVGGHEGGQLFVSWQLSQSPAGHRWPPPDTDTVLLQGLQGEVPTQASTRKYAVMGFWPVTVTDVLVFGPE